MSNKLALIADWQQKAIVMREDAYLAKLPTTDAESADLADKAKAMHIFNKQVEEARKEAVGPLNAQVRQINEQCKPISGALKAGIDRLKTQVADYQRIKERFAREEERKRREAAAEAEQAALEAAEKGDEAGFETQAQRAEDQQAMATVASQRAEKKTTPVSAGRVTTTKTWTFRVVDIAQVPRKYLMLDDRLVRSMLPVKSRGETDPPSIPGIEFFQKEGGRVF